MKTNEKYKLNIKDNFNPIIYLIYEVIKVYDTVNLLELDEKIIIHNQETDKYIELIKDDWVITHTEKDIGLRVYNTNPVEPFNIKYTYSDKYYAINKKPFLIINYRNNYFVRKIIDLETFTENKKLKTSWNLATLWDLSDAIGLYIIFLCAVAIGCIICTIVLKTIIPIFIWIALYLILMLIINR